MNPVPNMAHHSYNMMLNIDRMNNYWQRKQRHRTLAHRIKRMFSFTTLTQPTSRTSSMFQTKFAMEGLCGDAQK